MAESVRSLHLVFFIGAMCVVQTLAQVCPYSDPKCTCSLDSLTCIKLQQIPPLNTGANVSQIRHLSFQDGNITSIPTNSLPRGLTSIELFIGPLTNISDDAFDASATTLESVDIRGAQINTLPTALKKLTQLTKLSIDDVTMEDWDNVTLIQIADTLEDLRLSDMGLSSWPSWISNFYLLHTLDLSYNSIKSIPHYAFSFVKDSLTNLDLTHTGLTHVPQALSILTSLKSVDLKFNNFINVSEFELITRSQFAPNLLYINLESSGLTRIANFSSLTNLSAIDLTNNSISDIPAGSLPSSLIWVSLGQNSLFAVPQDVATMTSLYELLLFKNLITVIEPNSFPSRVGYLDLTFNNLSIITNSTFRNLNLLLNLRLSNNPISIIAPSAFIDLRSLQVLSITSSRLTEIPLALALLNPTISFEVETTQPLSCPCPAPNELVLWFTSLEHRPANLQNCSNGLSAISYLSGQCGQASATPSTTLLL